MPLRLSSFRLLLGALLLLVGGCTTMTPPTQVTRFHTLDLPVPGAGSYHILAGAPGQPDEWTSHAAAVGRELVRLGLSPQRAGAADVADYLVSVAVERRETTPPLAETRIGVGAGHGGGVGADVGLLFGGNRPTVTLRLIVRIRRPDAAVTLWEGRAVMTVPAAAPAAQPGIAADRMARALFADFPGTSGVTITVP